MKKCKCIKCKREFEMEDSFWGTILCEECDPAMNNNKSDMIKRIEEMKYNYIDSFQRYNKYKQNHPYQELVYKLYQDILSDLEELKKLAENKK